MDFKNERLMMSEEEARNRAKELLNENQVDLITKYMFLEQQVKKQKEVINKVNKYLNEYDVFKVFSFPLMKRWEEEQIKSSIDYEFKTSLVKDLKDILKEVSND
jgi:hypothetical protein